MRFGKQHIPEPQVFNKRFIRNLWHLATQSRLHTLRERNGRPVTTLSSDVILMYLNGGEI